MKRILVFITITIVFCASYVFLRKALEGTGTDAKNVEEVVDKEDSSNAADSEYIAAEAYADSYDKSDYEADSRHVSGWYGD